jgi:hypothetical protein
MRTSFCSPLLVDSTSWVDVSKVASPPIRVVQVLDLIRTPIPLVSILDLRLPAVNTVLIDCRAV